MRTCIAGILSIGLLVGTFDLAEADNPRKKLRRQHDSYDPRFPSATPQQVRNLHAFERGEYYEQDSNAHPVGSRSWWMLKERERGGDFRF
jgi:hypothetical protein